MRQAGASAARQRSAQQPKGAAVWFSALGHGSSDKGSTGARWVTDEWAVVPNNNRPERMVSSQESKNSTRHRSQDEGDVVCFLDLGVLSS